ncbi:MAG: helix-turn-helix transcriptional regulator [Pseudonocardiaceae bacterium]|jgi:transcriptional regulator with XRE-family HTH domain
MTDPAGERRRLAAALRDMRTDAGLSTTQLAARLGWSQSKVSKTELGRSRPQPDDVDAWARATRADPAIRDEMLRIASQAAVQATEWRRELAPGRQRKQEEIHRLEAAASVIRVFSPDVMVGFAQTRPYAEALVRLGRRVEPADDLDEAINARLARQTLLEDSSKRFELVMGETALRRVLIPPEAMRVQLNRLADLAAHRNVVVGVIPFRAKERVHQYHGFAILGDPEIDDEAIVLVETVTRAITVRATSEVAEYVDHFNGLRAAAIEGRHLKTLLQGVVAEVTTE